MGNCCGQETPVNEATMLTSPTDTRPDFLFNLLLVGDSVVGKSSLLLRFSENSFVETFDSTIGTDFKIKTVHTGDYLTKLQIWDTAGQQKGANGIIVVYDMTNPDTFANVRKWLQEIDRYAGPNVVKLLVGNKADLTSERRVTTKEAKEFAQKMGLQFLEASARDDFGVEETFMKLTNAVLHRSLGLRKV